MTRKGLRSGKWSFPVSKRPILRIINIKQLMDIHSWGLRFLEMWLILALVLTYIPNIVNHLGDRTRRVVGSKLSPIVDASLRISNPACTCCANVVLTPAGVR
jgi:hypothetical protein